MLVLLGGFLGSGRGMLASGMSQRHGLYLYDTQPKKMHRQVFQKDGSIKEVVLRTNTDERRTVLYRRMLEEFPILSKMYPDVVIVETFDRANLREHFIAEAARYFDKVVFVWIDSDEAHVRERLQRRQAEGKIANAETVLQNQRKRARELGSLEPGTRVFRCAHADDAEVDALWALIRRA